MTKINLTPAQTDKLEPIKVAGGYQNISAVIGALIAIYADDLLGRLSVVPMTAQSVPTTTQLGVITAQLVPAVTTDRHQIDNSLVPTTTQLGVITAQSVPLVTQSVPTAPTDKPKRPKFDF